MRYASIDIGTNTVLLLVGSVNKHRVVTEREEQRVPRLGKGVSANGMLAGDSMERVVEVLKEYREILETEYPEIDPGEVIVTATSAARDAENRDSFVSKVRRESGFRVRMLSGYEEAEWTYMGALSVLDNSYREHPCAVLDIGGGSTEVAYGVDLTLRDCHSFQMGSVRFTEQYLKEDPPGINQIRECEKAVEQMFRSWTFELPAGCSTIGVAGTVTSLAYLEAGLNRYEPSRLNGYQLEFETIDKWANQLSEMTTGHMVQMWPEIMVGRADIFIAGILILKGFMNIYNLPVITVSTGGIRYGALLQKGLGS